MGSRGSVIPEFLKQKKYGNFLVTEKSMTRFNISLESAVEMVLWALKNAIGGEIIIPKIKAFRRQLGLQSDRSQTKNKIMGIRPGEKLHEEMIAESDSFYTYDLGKYYALLNGEKKLLSYYEKKFNAKKVPINFSYNIDHNYELLKNLELKKLIKEYLSKKE